MIVKTRIKVDGVSYVTVKNVKSKFEQSISRMSYNDLIDLRSKVPRKQKSLINLELYHRYSKQYA